MTVCRHGKPEYAYCAECLRSIAQKENDTMPAPEPFKILSPGPHMTRDGRRMMVERNDGKYMGTHPWRGEDYLTRTDSGSVTFRVEHHDPSDIVSRCADTAPTRLSLAKAALEEAQMERDKYTHLAGHWQRIRNGARDELAAAESEAAQLAAIPPALLEVAREIQERHGHPWFGETVIRYLARSHSVDPAVLRAAMGAGK